MARLEPWHVDIECATYLGGHNPVITELGWDESLIGGA